MKCELLPDSPLTPNSRSYLNQFTQPDTIVPNPNAPADYNRFSYVRYNPLKYTDPSGHCIDPVTGQLSGGPSDVYCDLTQSQWEELGVTFNINGDSQSLNSTALAAAIQALNLMVKTYGFNAVSNGLNLKRGLTINIYTNVRDAPFSEFDHDGNGKLDDRLGGSYDWKTNTVNLYFNIRLIKKISTALHEFHHAMNQNVCAGGKVASAGECGFDSGFNVPDGVGSPSSDYGATNPNEDFAETGAWYVLTVNHLQSEIGDEGPVDADRFGTFLKIIDILGYRKPFHPRK